MAGSAHAVLWTAVGGLVLLFSGLGWIAAIVSLALTPAARREILEAQGTKRGLGFLLAGKICAWVTIGLSALAWCWAWRSSWAWGRTAPSTAPRPTTPTALNTVFVP